ncbi:MAG TPA: hypothetical protein VFF16_15695 [Telluria sp.]|nr:hypothetical protein [Telluria sp.]
MNLFGKFLTVAPAVGALLLTACGGGAGSAAGTTQLSPTIAVGEPMPQTKAVVVDDFKTALGKAECADISNNLYVIDQQKVLWARTGNCPDNASEHALFGATPQDVLCKQVSSIAGQTVSCKDAATRELFDKLLANLDQPDLGLGADHKVELVALGHIPVDRPVPVAPYMEVLVNDAYSGVTARQNLVIRDAMALARMWSVHVSGKSPAPEMPMIDFSTKMVVAVFLGQQSRGCTETNIVKLIPDGRQLEVDYETRDLQTFAICTASVTSPAVIAVVDRTDGAVSFVDRSAGKDVVELPFTMLEKSINSGVRDPQNLVIKDAATWAKVWAQHASTTIPAAPLPEVDFNKNMVIAAFGGMLPNACYNVGLADPVQSAGKITVSVVHSYPAPGVMCAMMIASPASMMLVARSDDPVEFVDVKAGW